MRTKLLYSILATAFAMLISACSGEKGRAVQSTLLIGIAEVNYTPEVGMDLDGNYRGSNYASRGIHDSLYSRAIVFANDKGEKAAMLTVDICHLSKEPVEMMRAYIASKSDIRAENIMICATHTHSGPKSDLNIPKTKEFLIKAANAVVFANQNLKPTIVSIGRSKEDRISHNRRLKCIDGSTHMCWEKLKPGFVIGPWGPKDSEVITMSLEQDGKSTAVLINFGCHATTLTGNNWLYSADYPGYLREAIKRVKGKNYMSLFFNGCCGNITQVDYKVGFPDTYQECQRIGYILGVSALEAINNEQAVSTNKIAVSREMVPVKKITITAEQKEWADNIIRKVEKEGLPPAQADGIPDAEYAKSWIELSKTQEQIDSLEVQVIRIGDIAFVGLPGEMFAEFGLDIKARSACKNTLVMGLTNDDRNYFPTKISFTQGPKGFTPMITGYETTPGSTTYEIGAGEKLTESAVIQLKKLFE